MVILYIGKKTVNTTHCSAGAILLGYALFIAVAVTAFYLQGSYVPVADLPSNLVVNSIEFQQTVKRDFQESI